MVVTYHFRHDFSIVPQCGPARGYLMKLSIPDVISNSYFPAAAAIELGFFKQEGLDVTLEHIRPVTKTYEALRDGQIDFVGASAHAALSAFPEWNGVKLLCAQGQGMYWFLVMRAGLGAKRGDLSAVKGRTIGAAPWIELGLRRLLADAGIDAKRDGVNIVPIPPDPTAKVAYNFGVMDAAKALEDGKLDGFWANGMGAAGCRSQRRRNACPRRSPRRRTERLF